MEIFRLPFTDKTDKPRRLLTPEPRDLARVIPFGDDPNKSTLSRGLEEAEIQRDRSIVRCNLKKSIIIFIFIKSSMFSDMYRYCLKRALSRIIE